jgi:hypothetical protein
MRAELLAEDGSVPCRTAQDSRRPDAMRYCRSQWPRDLLLTEHHPKSAGCSPDEPGNRGAAPRAGQPAVTARRDRGSRACIAIRLPLFEVHPARLGSARYRRMEFDALILTSANAIRHGGPGLRRLLNRLPVYAVGDADRRRPAATGGVRCRLQRPVRTGAEANLSQRPKRGGDMPRAAIIAGRGAHARGRRNRRADDHGLCQRSLWRSARCGSRLAGSVALGPVGACGRPAGRDCRRARD